MQAGAGVDVGCMEDVSVEGSLSAYTDGNDPGAASEFNTRRLEQLVHQTDDLQAAIKHLAAGHIETHEDMMVGMGVTPMLLSHTSSIDVAEVDGSAGHGAS